MERSCPLTTIKSSINKAKEKKKRLKMMDKNQTRMEEIERHSYFSESHYFSSLATILFH